MCRDRGVQGCADFYPRGVRVVRFVFIGLCGLCVCLCVMGRAGGVRGVRLRAWTLSRLCRGVDVEVQL